MKEDLIICRCEEVTLEEIDRAVQDGARSVNAIRRRTRAGMGTCQGRTCQPLVREVLAHAVGRSREDTAAATIRPPVRPVLLADILAAPASPEEETGGPPGRESPPPK